MSAVASAKADDSGSRDQRLLATAKTGLARMERAKPRIFLFSFVGCLSLQAGSSLFKPRSSRSAADGEDQIAVGIEESGPCRVR